MHTPGPWQYNYISGRIEDAGNDGATIATLAATERDDTGWLIAAAPELLEALIILTSNNEMNGEIQTDVMNKARVAIRKAQPKTGE